MDKPAISRRSFATLWLFVVLGFAVTNWFLFRLAPPSHQAPQANQISLRQQDGNIEYNYLGGPWHTITTVASLTGKDGTPGANGEKGDTGTPGKNGSNGQDGKDGQNGTTGTNGKQIELQKTPLYIQWRYQGDSSWTNLIALSDLKGDKGDTGDAGATGPANSLTIGTVNRTNCNPTASITGTSPSQTLNLGIPGIPTGGNPGQVLTKNSGADCDASWTNSRNNTASCADLQNYVWVPGNAKYGTLPGFCVMKYTASANDGNTTSTNYGAGNAVVNGALPWVSISQINATTAAGNACNGCHLITEPEWMTIATNIMNQPANWTSGVVGTGSLYTGHNDNNPANALAANTSDDTDGYYGTGNSGTSNQRRTFWIDTGNGPCLNNGVQANNNCAALWDMAGNVYQWTDAVIRVYDTPTIAGSDDTASSNVNWRQYTALNKHTSGFYDSMPTLALQKSWTTTQGIGQLYGADDTATSQTNTGLRGFPRGCYWPCSSHTGIFTLTLSVDPATAAVYIGFRVAR